MPLIDGGDNKAMSQIKKQDALKKLQLKIQSQMQKSTLFPNLGKEKKFVKPTPIAKMDKAKSPVKKIPVTIIFFHF